MTQLPDVPLDGLYGDLVMDHYRNPRNRAPIRDADVEAEAYSEVLDLIDEGAKANAEGDELQEAEHAKKGN